MANKIIIAAYAVVVGGFIGCITTIGLSLPKDAIANYLTQPDNVFIERIHK